MKLGKLLLTLSAIAVFAAAAQADSQLDVTGSATFVNPAGPGEPTPNWNGPFNVAFSYAYDLTTGTVSDITFSDSGANLGLFTLTDDFGGNLAWGTGSSYGDGITFYTSLEGPSTSGGFVDMTLYLPGVDGTIFSAGAGMLTPQSETQTFSDPVVPSPETDSLLLLAAGLAFLVLRVATANRRALRI
ncbi:MAG TPA: hypothetical protein VN875_01170 [Candidatus Binatus sp.]|nr:hypothetical protein [Candidatus Binatus sp.]